MSGHMVVPGAASAANSPRRRLRLWQAVVGVLALILSEAADAAPATCGQRADVLARLARQFNEVPAAIGLDNSGSLIEVLTTDDGATWSIVITTPRGVSCVVATGESWQELTRTTADGPQI